MAAGKIKLTQKAVDAATVKGREKTLWDSAAEGLGLKVTAAGRRSYVYKYKSPGGKLRSMTLGAATDMRLKAARDRARTLAERVNQGGDPAVDQRNAKYFTKNKYVIVRRMIEPEVAELAHQYALILRNAGGFYDGDPQVPGTPNRYNDSLMETLLGQLVPKIEAATGLDLHPTYSYLRIYKPGDTLKRHTDRPSCEISMTIPLGFDGDECWPIQADNGDHSVVADLQPGDAMVYRGCDVAHWRDEFTGKHQVQVFLHYVDKNGPHADRKFDTRPSLGARSNTKDPERYKDL